LYSALAETPLPGQTVAPHLPSNNLLNTASLARWVESNDHLPALGVWGNRDAATGNLMSAFQFRDGGGEGGGGDGGGGDGGGND
jgi:hypothetical protein